MAVRHFVGTVTTVCIVGASVLMAPSGAHGQMNAPAGIGVGASVDVEAIQSDETGNRIWVAKFLCGEIRADGSPETGSPLAPGSYRTAINVFNGKTGGRAIVSVTLARAESPDLAQLAAFPGDVIVESLRAVELDCEFIRRAFAGVSLTPFVKGFMRLAVSRDDGNSKLVKVVAVYTLKNVEPASPPPNP